MKTYKEFPKYYIGESDSAKLRWVGGTNRNDMNWGSLHFGEDGAYDAYVIDQDGSVKIGSHYVKEFSCNNMLNIFDDSGRTFHIYGDRINVYRAGMYGCIIEVCSQRQK